MRGKVKPVPGKARQNRITPAYAGKSFAYAEAFAVAEDHPRLCGEKRCSTRQRSDATGSPPPMRGKGYSVPQVRTGNGITPAYAGKSSYKLCYTIYRGDHPRLCGEKKIWAFP